MQNIEQDAKRIFAAHSGLIAQCIGRFSTYAKHDGQRRVSLGFMPHSPEKYAQLSALYQSVHNVLVCFYHAHKDGANHASLDDWFQLLQFDPSTIRRQQGWDAGDVPLIDQTFVLYFDRFASDVLAFRTAHLKEILILARREADAHASEGKSDAGEMLQAISDSFFARQKSLSDLEAAQAAEANRRFPEHGGSIRLTERLGNLLRSVA